MHHHRWQGHRRLLDGARFQAYEAMLRGTDLSMWADWMVTGAKVGEAPGYRVDGLIL